MTQEIALYKRSLWRDVYTMAGVLRMDYRPFTYRELVIMYESNALTSWDHTALISASIRNVLVTKRQDLTQPTQVHPYRPGRDNNRMILTHDNFNSLKHLAVG